MRSLTLLSTEYAAAYSLCVPTMLMPSAMQTALLVQLHPIYPGFWIALSLATLILVRLMARYWSPRSLRWLTIVRWVLIPYIGILAGSLSPRLMGLTAIDWRLTLGIGVVVLATVIVLLAAIRFLYDDGPTQATDISATAPAATDLGDENEAVLRFTLWSLLVSGAEQFHWSFLRGAVWETLLLTQTSIDLVGYWSVWIAALLTLPEIVLQPLTGHDRLFKGVILVLSAGLFILTRNFWLCWILHAAAWLLLTAIPRTQKAGAVSPL